MRTASGWFADAGGWAGGREPPQVSPDDLASGRGTAGASTDGARGLALAGDGSVWVAAEAYVPVLYHFLPWLPADQPSTWRIYDSPDGLPRLPASVTNSDPVQAVAVASPGDIWIATTEHATHCRFDGE